MVHKFVAKLLKYRILYLKTNPNKKMFAFKNVKLYCMFLLDLQHKDIKKGIETYFKHRRKTWINK